MLRHFLLARVRCRESQAQYALNPAQCQRTTVSGWTRINACFHPGQNRFNTFQNNRSEAANRGCGCLCFKTASCCRRARFSNGKSRRERKSWMARIDRSLSRRSISQFYTARAKVNTLFIWRIRGQIAILASHRYVARPPRQTFSRVKVRRPRFVC